MKIFAFINVRHFVYIKIFMTNDCLMEMWFNFSGLSEIIYVDNTASMHVLHLDLWMFLRNIFIHESWKTQHLHQLILENALHITVSQDIKSVFKIFRSMFNPIAIIKHNECQWTSMLYFMNNLNKKVLIIDLYWKLIKCTLYIIFL